MPKATHNITTLKRHHRRRLPKIFGRGFTLRNALFDSARAWRAFPKLALVLIVSGLIMAGIGALGHFAIQTTLGLAATLIAAPVGVAHWWIRHVIPAGTTAKDLSRGRVATNRTEGVAGKLDIAQYAGPGAMRLKQRACRPSHRQLTKRELHRIPLEDFAVLIAEVGIGWWGQQVWSPCEDVTLRIGGPRSGKTVGVACHGVDAPGALVVASTKTDLAEWIHPARQHTEIYRWNPYDRGGYGSNFTWSVLVGCEDFNVANRRAKALMPTSTDSKVEHWQTLGRPILALLLHAAAIGDADGKSYRAVDILRWLSDSSKTAYLDQICEAIMRSPDKAAAAKRSQIRAHWTLNHDTRTSIDSAIKPCLYWAGDDRIASLGDSPRDQVSFDFERLIREKGTLYIVGADEEGSPLAPLVAALVTELAHVALDMAGKSPGGRLDPPLTMILDEAALICPVPLPKWTSFYGGQGITLHIAAQSLAQLRDRWGADGAIIIRSNAATFLFYGGSNSDEELEGLARLAGEALIREPGVEKDQPGAKTRRRVLDVADLRRIKEGRAAVYRRGIPPLVGWIPSIRERKVPGTREEWKPAATLLSTAEIAARKTATLLEETAVIDPVPTAAELAEAYKLPTPPAVPAQADADAEVK